MPPLSHRPAAARPELHATPATGWLNDAHGIAWHRGRYHLFHQAVPDRQTWAPDLSWGHLTSPDLVTWTALPSALAPGDGDHGCWSGDLLVPGPAARDGGARLYYTSVAPPDLGLGAVRTAHAADDDWTIWRKGPVVVRPPAGVTMFRDPTVVRDGDRWRLLVGAGLDGGRPAVLGYTSTDLRSWEPTGPFAVAGPPGSEPFDPGDGWECPHLVEVGGRAALIVSVWGARDGGRFVGAAAGRLEGDRFVAERWQRLTYEAPYAPTTFRDVQGRPCLLFWLRGPADPEAGWAGALSVPYVVEPADAVTGAPFRLAPHPAVRAARRPERAVGLTWGTPDRPPAGRLELRAADGGTAVTLTATHDGLRVDVAGGPASDLPPADGAVHVIADGPVLEVCSGASLFGAALARAAVVDEVSAASADGSVATWWT